jgi:electron transfer flavoprotein alpha subunit
MSEVLVLVDCDKSVGGKVTKPTLELLTIARRLGALSAVVIGSADHGVTETLKKFGAEKIYSVTGGGGADDTDLNGFLVGPEGRGAGAAGGGDLPGRGAGGLDR